NGGFNRDGALLAVILITDEDDCSTTDPRVFDIEARASNPYQGPFTSMGQLQFNLRCSEHNLKDDDGNELVLQKISRYVDEIAALKDDPSQVVFAAITGIPEDSALDRENFNSDEERYAGILTHANMKEIADPARKVDQPDQQLAPACTSTDEFDQESLAFPARRIVETMQRLAAGNTGVGTVVESICADDYAPALNAIIDRIAAALRQLCLPRPLNRNSQDLVGCEVREVQPEGSTCATAGRGREEEPVGTEDVGTDADPDMREVCRITQLPSDPAVGVPGGLGWFYDRFECLQTAPPTTQDIGWPCNDGDEGEADTICNPDPENCLAEESLEECETRILKERYDRDNLKLTCDPGSNTCQLTCQSNVECPGGFACFDASGDRKSYCVNPTCNLN
ncbi:MAG: hypothetical protein JRG67_17255, partial [Deltaproteobacteria bacterium]|nr:hypothetical protein [Deltaproteobacteria bacterium]